MTAYKCPQCGSDDLAVAVHAFATLTQSEGNLETEVIGDHEWDGDSAAMCRSCDWVGCMNDAYQGEPE